MSDWHNSIRHGMLTQPAPRSPLEREVEGLRAVLKTLQRVALADGDPDQKLGQIVDLIQQEL